MLRKKQIKKMIENNSMLLIIATYAAFSLLSSGQKGDTGKDGAQGEKGDKGDKGSSGGPIGPKGDDGTNGTEGIDGIGFEFKVFAIGQSYNKNHYVFAASTLDTAQNSLWIAQKDFTATVIPNATSGNWVEHHIPKGKDGNDIHQGIYDISKDYKMGETISYTGKIYILTDILKQETPGTVNGNGWVSLAGQDGIGLEYVPVMPASGYFKNNYIFEPSVSNPSASHDSLWIALDGVGLLGPVADPTHWIEHHIPTGTDGIGFEFKVFSIGQSYTKNNYVIAVSSSDAEQNSLYFAKTDFTSAVEPKLDATNWAELFSPDGIDGKDIFKGTYTNTETYLIGDIVVFSNSLYILKDNTQQAGGPGVGTGWYHITNDKLVTTDSTNVFAVAQEFAAGVVVKGSSSALSFTNDSAASNITSTNSTKLEINNGQSKIVLEDGKVGINVDPITDVHLNGNILIGDTMDEVENMSDNATFSSITDALENSQLILGGAINKGVNINTSSIKPKVKLFIYGTNNDADQGVPINPIVVEDENGNPEFILTSRKTFNGIPDAHFYGDVTVEAQANFKGDVIVNGSFLPPKITTVQRDALTKVAGMMIYNTIENKHQGCNGTEWINFY